MRKKIIATMLCLVVIFALSSLVSCDSREEQYMCVQRVPVFIKEARYNKKKLRIGESVEISVDLIKNPYDIDYEFGAFSIEATDFLIETADGSLRDRDSLMIYYDDVEGNAPDEPQKEYPIHTETFKLTYLGDSNVEIPTDGKVHMAYHVLIDGDACPYYDYINLYLQVRNKGEYTGSTEAIVDESSIPSLDFLYNKTENASFLKLKIKNVQEEPYFVHYTASPDNHIWPMSGGVDAAWYIAECEVIRDFYGKAEEGSNVTFLLRSRMFNAELHSGIDDFIRQYDTVYLYTEGIRYDELPLFIYDESLEDPDAPVKFPYRKELITGYCGSSVGSLHLIPTREGTVRLDEKSRYSAWLHSEYIMSIKMQFRGYDDFVKDGMSISEFEENIIQLHKRLSAD